MSYSNGTISGGFPYGVHFEDLGRPLDPVYQQSYETTLLDTTADLVGKLQLWEAPGVLYVPGKAVKSASLGWTSGNDANSTRQLVADLIDLSVLDSNLATDHLPVALNGVDVLPTRSDNEAYILCARIGDVAFAGYPSKLAIRGEKTAALDELSPGRKKFKPAIASQHYVNLGMAWQLPEANIARFGNLLRQTLGTEVVLAPVGELLTEDRSSQP